MLHVHSAAPHRDVLQHCTSAVHTFIALCHSSSVSDLCTSASIKASNSSMYDYTCLLMPSAAALTSGSGVMLSAAGSLPPIVTPTLPCSTVLLL
jgi:hypothetical protein